MPSLWPNQTISPFGGFNVVQREPELIDYWYIVPAHPVICWLARYIRISPWAYYPSQIPDHSRVVVDHDRGLIYMTGLQLHAFRNRPRIVNMDCTS